MALDFGVGGLGCLIYPFLNALVTDIIVVIVVGTYFYKLE